MSEVVQFSCPLPPKALSPNARAHWREKNAAKQAYAEQVWIAGQKWQDEREYDRTLKRVVVHGARTYSGTSAFKGDIFFLPWEGPVSVHLIWHSCWRKDQDNIVSQCKVLIDTLTTKGTHPLGFFIDDKDARVTAEWQKVSTKPRQRVEVRITRVQ